MKRAPEWLHVVVYLVIGGLLLLIWPAGAIASVMGLGGYIPQGTPILTILCGYIFHLGVLCYPVVYISCLIVSILRMTAGSETESKYYPPSFWAGLPLIYVAVVFLMIFVGSIPSLYSW